VRRFLSWFSVNADTLLALILAILVSILNILGIISSAVVANATVATLAVLAFILLHDRKMQGETKNKIEGLERKIDTRNPIRYLAGSDISAAIAEARRSTDQWFFRGSTATYVRVVVLPDCINRARRAGKEFRARLEILDPVSINACRNYVRLYQSLAEGPDSPEMNWTVKGTQVELYATILAVCWWKNRYESLSIELALTNIASTFRWEAASHYFILTQRGPRFPAMLIEHGDPYYHLFTSELNASFRQARKVQLELCDHTDLSDDPSVEEVRKLLAKLGIDIPASFDDSDVCAIIDKALHDKNPYSD
jgi:hypothetical protein